MAALSPSIGDLLRMWRKRRRLSQLALSLDAGISQRHLSFVESGRSRPSRETILGLAQHLRVPLRDRNAMLMASGFAPEFAERPFASPDMARTRKLVDRILNAYDPHPALALDRGWNILAMNQIAALLTKDVDPSLLEGEVNALRLTFHPLGLASRIVNFDDWRKHILRRLSHDIDVCGDHRLIELIEELKSYPAPYRSTASPKPAVPDIALPLILDSPDGRLSFLSATTVFGTAVDVTVSDLVIETLFPADDQTVAALVRHSRDSPLSAR
jgi:transcriptional regulator with XRE-family HTH domain